MELVWSMYCDVIIVVWYMSVNNPHAICVWPGFCLISIKVCSVKVCSGIRFYRENYGNCIQSSFLKILISVQVY